MSLLSKIDQLSQDECLRLCLNFANSHKADAVAIIKSSSTKDEVEIYCGISNQDQSYREFINSINVHSPIIFSVINRQKSIRLMDASRHPELDEWRKALELPIVSSLMQIPFSSEEDLNEEIWALLLLKSSGHWQVNDQSTVAYELNNYDFDDVEETIFEEINVLNDETIDSIQGETEILNGAEISPFPELPNISIDKLENENRQQKEDIERLLAYIDNISNEFGKGRHGDHFQIEQDNLINDLKIGNQELKESLSEMDQIVVPDHDEAELVLRAKEELKLALVELADLNNKLYQEQSQAESLQENSKADSTIPAEKAERIAGIAQEMRQPLSSILGYTDLLLGETVGILGALQRNFLKRVHNSSERIDALIADLIQLAELDASGIDVSRKAVNVSGVIDDVVNRLGPQLAKKQIIMRVDLPKTLPNIETDEDALHQIIFHLLQNAYIATPINKEITLRAFTNKKDDLGEYLLIQLSDSGGGIADSDLPRVFSRVYRAENPVIEGVGDTGVGLAIAETLSSALGGRIWVESETGKGSTYSVLLPFEANIDIPVSS